MPELKERKYWDEFTQDEILQLWDLLADVPIDNNDCIDEDFIGFEKGTDRLDVWLWFDRHYEGGAVTLLYKPDERKKDNG